MALVHPSGPVQPPRQRLHNKQRAGRSREAGKHTIGNDAHKHYGRVRATRGHFQANLELLHPEAVALQPGISVHTTQSETKAAPTRKDRPTTCSALRLHNVQLPDGRSAPPGGAPAAHLRACACALCSPAVTSRGRIPVESPSNKIQKEGKTILFHLAQARRNKKGERRF